MQSTQLKNLWKQVTAEARNFLSEGACTKWIDPLKPLSLEKNILTLAVSDDLQKQWVEERYLSKLEEVVFDLSGEHLSISLKLVKRKSRPIPENKFQTTLSIQETSENPEVLKFSGEENKIPAGQVAPFDDSSLNRRYTFENFVIGKCNEFAHAAALAICKSPGSNYNPFFIYGGVGLGKTHLMHAIGNRILRTMPTKRVVYVTSEQFTNDLINAIREHKLGGFKNKYRKADVLLIDDIQFISGKDSTQEEFFHTFNELHNADKQIILSADRTPQDITGLEERLKSRFAWGLCTDMQKPDLETRIAILQKKATLDRVDVPPNVISEIARRVNSNVRDLEGAFTRIIAGASLMNKSYASMLHEFSPKNEEQNSLPEDKMQVNPEGEEFEGEELFPTLSDELSLKQIVRTVADYFSFKPELILSNNRALKVVRPRQIAMFLCRTLTTNSWSVIANFFGKHDHATVMRAYHKIKGELATNPQLVELLKNMFPKNF